MDFPGLSFCVENKKKIKFNPLPLLTSAIQQTQSMSVQHNFSGIHLNGHKMEDQCLPHIFEMEQYTKNILSDNVHNFSCTQNIIKDEPFQTSKTVFGHCSQFPAITFSKLVGGFVGSKSQVRSTNRDSCQIWDIIFRELAKSTSHKSAVKNSAHECYNLGKTLSQNIFGSFCQETRSAFDITSYFGFFQDTTLFQNQSKSSCKDKNKPDQGSSTKEPTVPILTKPSVVANSILSSLEREKSAVSMAEESKTNNSPTGGPKQSYADVAKSFTATRTHMTNSQQGNRKINEKDLTRRGRKMPANRDHRESLCNQKWQPVDRRNWRDQTESVRYYRPTSQYYTSQKHRNRSATMQQSLPFKNQEQNEPDKPGKDRGERVWNQNRVEYNKMSTRTNRKDYRKSQSAVEHKSEVLANERKSRNGFRTVESRMQKRVDASKNNIMNIEEGRNFGTKSERTCMNWRCRNDICDMSGKTKCFSPVSNNTCASKTLVSSSNELGVPTEPVPIARDRSSSESSISNIVVGSRDRERTLSEASSGSQKPPNLARELSSSLESNSVTSLSSSTSDSSNCRRRYPSECESEDSFVVAFESDCNTDVVYRCSSPDVSESGSWTECDTSDDDDDSDAKNNQDERSDAEDELDFCHISFWDIHPCDDNALSQMSNKARLKDVNEKWREEYSMLPCVEKTPQKVQFAYAGALTTVHPMIKWDYAYRAARCGPWEGIMRDRMRFRDRIKRIEPVLAAVFNPQHRDKVWKDRVCNDGVT